MAMPKDTPPKDSPLYKPFVDSIKEKCNNCGKPDGKKIWADELGLHCTLCSPFVQGGPYSEDTE